MAKKMYVGVSGVARNVKQPYIGVNAVARKVKNGYVGVNGVARQWWGSQTITFYINYMYRTITFVITDCSVWSDLVYRIISGTDEYGDEYILEFGTGSIGQVFAQLTSDSVGTDSGENSVLYLQDYTQVMYTDSIIDGYTYKIQ